MKKILISLSGGLDSTTLLSQVLFDGFSCSGVFFNYGSKHNKYEEKAINDIAQYYNIPLFNIPLSNIMEKFESSLLLNSLKEIPEGHYNDESMKQTVVPARNLIFLSIMAGLAESLKINNIGIGVHQGDHYIYPDCRPDFIGSISQSIYLATNKKVQVHAPFLYETKEGIVKIGTKLNTPYYLTRTCYKNQNISCGKCGSCVERLEAFSKNGLKDPICYE